MVQEKSRSLRIISSPVADPDYLAPIMEKLHSEIAQATTVATQLGLDQDQCIEAARLSLKISGALKDHSTHDLSRLDAFDDPTAARATVSEGEIEEFFTAIDGMLASIRAERVDSFESMQVLPGISQNPLNTTITEIGINETALDGQVDIARAVFDAEGTLERHQSRIEALLSGNTADPSDDINTLEYGNLDLKQSLLEVFRA